MTQDVVRRARLIDAGRGATDASRSFVTFEPVGVILAVMPWNFPLWQVFRFTAPALMAGNVAVLKGFQRFRLRARHRGHAPAGGFPGDVFRTLLIVSKAARSVLRNRFVRAVTLTGSPAAGRSLAAAAGKLLKKSVLELGGSDAYIIREDADLEHAASVCATSRLINSGQSCIAAKRFTSSRPCARHSNANSSNACGRRKWATR